MIIFPLSTVAEYCDVLYLLLLLQKVFWIIRKENIVLTWSRLFCFSSYSTLILGWLQITHRWIHSCRQFVVINTKSFSAGIIVYLGFTWDPAPLARDNISWNSWAPCTGKFDPSSSWWVCNFFTGFVICMNPNCHFPLGWTWRVIFACTWWWEWQLLLCSNFCDSWELKLVLQNAKCIIEPLEIFLYPFKLILVVICLLCQVNGIERWLGRNVVCLQSLIWISLPYPTCEKVPNVLSRYHSKRRLGVRGRAHPSFDMTPTFRKKEKKKKKENLKI